MAKHCELFLPLLLITAASSVFTTNSTARERLAKALFQDYNTKLRPVKSARAMNVFLDMTLYQILEVNLKQQYVLVYVWMKEYWEDDYLFWDPTKFDNIVSLHVAAEDIWKPDTYLQTNIEMDQTNTERLMTAVLNPETGSSKTGINRTWVTMTFPAIYKVACFMDMSYFPWDTQTCPMEFTSWTFDMTKLDYDSLKNSVNLKEYRPNQEYDLLDFPITKTEFCVNTTHPRMGTMSSCFSYVNFTLIIQQKALFYIFNLVIPSSVLCMICFVGLFSLSSSSGERSEKISLGMTTMLALSIIMMVISDQMPKTSIKIPIIGWYFLLQMLLIGSALVATVFVVHLYKDGKDGKPIPLWLMRLTRPFLSYEKISNWNQTKQKPIKVNPAADDEQNELPIKQSAVEVYSEILMEVHEHLQTVQSMVQDAGEFLESKEQQKVHLQNWDAVIGVLEKMLFAFFSLVDFLTTGLFLLFGYLQYFNLPDKK